MARDKLTQNQRKVLILLEEAGEHGLYGFELALRARGRPAPELVESLRKRGHDIRQKETDHGNLYWLVNDV